MRMPGPRVKYEDATFHIPRSNHARLDAGLCRTPYDTGNCDWLKKIIEALAE